MFKFCRIGTTNIVCYDNGLILRFNKQHKKWTVCKGTFIKSKYLNMEIDRKQYYCHRIVAYAFGILALDSSLQIDHIDRNRINNSISNFRVVTQQQNNFNQGSKGYSWHGRLNKWQSRISLNRKSIHLGYFDTEEEASKAYQGAKLIYHSI